MYTLTLTVSARAVWHQPTPPPPSLTPTPRHTHTFNRTFSENTQKHLLHVVRINGYKDENWTFTERWPEFPLIRRSRTDDTVIYQWYTHTPKHTHPVSVFDLSLHSVGSSTEWQDHISQGAVQKLELFCSAFVSWHLDHPLPRGGGEGGVGISRCRWTQIIYLCQ